MATNSQAGNKQDCASLVNDDGTCSKSTNVPLGDTSLYVGLLDIAKVMVIIFCSVCAAMGLFGLMYYYLKTYDK